MWISEIINNQRALLLALQRSDYVSIEQTPALRRSVMGSIEVLESIQKSESAKKMIPANDASAKESPLAFAGAV